jgi:hypothetical protein
MIFRHYRRWIPGLQVGAGRRINRWFEKTLGVIAPSEVNLQSSLRASRTAKMQDVRDFSMVEAGGIENPHQEGTVRNGRFSADFSGRFIYRTTGVYRHRANERVDPYATPPILLPKRHSSHT